jgi:hypothetical protein
MFKPSVTGAASNVATPRGARAKSTSVPATIRFAAIISLRPSLERITTLAGTPRASCAPIVCGPAPCDEPDPVVTLVPLVRSNSGKSGEGSCGWVPTWESFMCSADNWKIWASASVIRVQSFLVSKSGGSFGNSNTCRRYSHPRSPNSERSTPGGAYHPVEP